MQRQVPGERQQNGPGRRLRQGQQSPAPFEPATVFVMDTVQVSGTVMGGQLERNGMPEAVRLQIGKGHR